MIQFNLLPDVKIKYIKARRQKRMVMLGAFLVGAGSLAVLVLTILYVYGVQGAQIASLNKSIKTHTASINKKNGQVDDIGKVLTVQNQLVALDSLHAEKPIMSRAFDYLAKLTPAQVTISKISIDNGTMLLQGSTDTLETVNKFVDTLKFTTFKADKDATDATVFTGVALSSFSRDKSGASYTINFNYDPIIFAASSKVPVLTVPNKITTRSELGRPILQTEIEKANNAPTPVGGK